MLKQSCMGWTLDVLICTLCHYCFTALISMITIQDILMKLDLSLPCLSMRSFDNQEKQQQLMILQQLSWHSIQ